MRKIICTVRGSLCPLQITDLMPGSLISCFVTGLLTWSAPRPQRTAAVHALTRGPDIEELIGDPDDMASFIANHADDLSSVLHLVWPPLPSWDASIRLKMAYTCCWAAFSAGLFWKCLGESQLKKTDLVRKIETTNGLYEKHESLVQHLSLVIATYWNGGVQLPDRDLKESGGWLSLFRMAIHLGGLKIGFQHGCYSPMLTFLFDQHETWVVSDELLECARPKFANQRLAQLSSERLTHKLRFWAREVQRAGQDLKHYGSWESKFLSASGERFSLCRYGCDTCTTFKVVKFIFGASPLDWQVWVSTSADEATGDFWRELTEPEASYAVPGEWPEEIRRCPGVQSNQDFWLPDREESSRFFRSKRHRRRLRRYCGTDNGSNTPNFSISGLKVEREWYRLCANKQKEFFLENDIPPIPRTRY
jgi:hypothetical protein